MLDLPELNSMLFTFLLSFAYVMIRGQQPAGMQTGRARLLAPRRGRACQSEAPGMERCCAGVMTSDVHPR